MKALITNFLEPISFGLMLLTFVLVRRRRNQPGIQLLVVHSSLSILFTLLGSIHVALRRALYKNLINSGNILLYDLLALSSALLIGAYFYRHLEAVFKKRLVVVLIAGYVVYAVVREATLSGQRLFDSIGYAALSASVTIYAFLFFHQLLQRVSEASILRQFNFWLSAAYLLYFAGGFIIFISYYYFTQKLLANPSKEGTTLLTWLWGLHNVLLFISALLLLSGSLWIVSRKRSA